MEDTASSENNAFHSLDGFRHQFKLVVFKACECVGVCHFKKLVLAGMKKKREKTGLKNEIIIIDDDEILLKREPLIYTTARRALQENSIHTRR